MLPWVLLYGFTALLFNHPTWFTDTKTTIERFKIPAAAFDSFPDANKIAALAVEAAQNELGDSSMNGLTLADQFNATFVRQAFGSIENESLNTSVIVDLNTGSGYLRKKTKPESASTEQHESEQGPNLENGLKLKLDSSPKTDIQHGLNELLTKSDLDSQQLQFRSLPPLEFDATYGGQPVRLRFAQRSSRGRDRNAESPDDDTFSGELTIVGSNPREISARRFLLRLHMAHGYPVQTNSKWFWAVAVDLMFASMVFWGLSGVFMWWQIKRTRKIGLFLLFASAVVATALGIGMHWQLVNG